MVVAWSVVAATVVLVPVSPLESPSVVVDSPVWVVAVWAASVVAVVWAAAVVALVAVCAAVFAVLAVVAWLAAVVAWSAPDVDAGPAVAAWFPAPVPLPAVLAAVAPDVCPPST